MAVGGTKVGNEEVGWPMDKPRYEKGEGLRSGIPGKAADLSDPMWMAEDYVAHMQDGSMIWGKEYFQVIVPALLDKAKQAEATAKELEIFKGGFRESEQIVVRLQAHNHRLDMLCGIWFEAVQHTEEKFWCYILVGAGLGITFWNLVPGVITLIRGWI